MAAATRKRPHPKQALKRLAGTIHANSDTYLARRPHRSFRRTYRRDYLRSLAIPGYFSLTIETIALIVKNRRLFGKFFLLYGLASAIILGAINQASYTTLTDTIRGASNDLFIRTFSVFSAAITGGLNPTANTDSTVLASLLIVVAWLVLIWLLRHIVKGTKVTLREGLYNAGAPIVPTILVALVLVIQALPLIIAAIGYTAASGSGIVSGGVEAMLFFAVAGLLVLLSLYWMTSTLIALVIVTLPGMYPWAALRAAGDLAVGRRLRLILRLVWLAVLVVGMWILLLVPIILLDNWLTLSWLPLVPIAVLALSTLTLILASTYIYLLYRHLVADKAKPA